MPFPLALFLGGVGGGLDLLGSLSGNSALRRGAQLQMHQVRLRQAQDNAEIARDYQTRRGEFDVIVGNADASGQAFTDVLMSMAADAAGDAAATDMNADAQVEGIKESARSQMKSPILSFASGAFSAFASGVGLQAGVKELGGWGAVLGV